MRVGLLVNPGSGRGSGRGLSLAKELKAIPVEILARFSELEPALHRLAAQSVDLLAISSGDGTIHAIQTLINEKPIFKPLPTLCILPHGTTNQNANDIGLKIKNIPQQALFLEKGAVSRLVQRPTIRILNARDGHVRHGMFLGGGAVTPAVNYAQTHLNDRGIHGAKAAVMTFVKAAGDYMFNRQSPQRIGRPYEMSIRLDGVQLEQGPQLMFMCTTLKKLMAATYPFWGTGSGALHITSFPYPPPGLVRWGYSIARGRQAAEKSGCMSRNADKAEIQSQEFFMLDGEFFEGPEQGALKIEAGPLLSYAVG